MDAIYTLRVAIEKNINKGKTKGYVLSTDLKGAFNKISSKKIWNRLETLGIEEKLEDCL